MRALVVNDDGIDAPGLTALAKALSEKYEVIIVAPDGERSAFSHSLSIMRGLKCNKVDKSPLAAEAWAVSGTPADCVKFAVLHAFKDRPPDFIVSGINNGGNVGSDIMYSGTVSAAAEGSYLGFPSIAVSLTAHNMDAEYYEKAAAFFMERLPSIFALNLKSDTVININYPDYRDYKGFKVTKAGFSFYFDHFISVEGGDLFELHGTRKDDHDRNDEDCDVEWVKKGYAAITPLHLDRTDHKALEKIKDMIK